MFRLANRTNTLLHTSLPHFHYSTTTVIILHTTTPIEFPVIVYWFTCLFIGCSWGLRQERIYYLLLDGSVWLWLDSLDSRMSPKGNPKDRVYQTIKLSLMTFLNSVQKQKSLYWCSVHNYRIYRIFKTSRDFSTKKKKRSCRNSAYVLILYYLVR